MTTTTARIHGLAALCTLAVAAPAAAAPTTIDALPLESGLDAGQGALVWSRYDDAAKAYRLVVRRMGVGAEVGIERIRTRGDWRDAVDPVGEPAVVYSRCASYKHDRDHRDRCDLYILSLKTGAERAIANANTSASESSPTLWRGQLAWLTERKSGQAGYHRSLRAPASRKSRRLPDLPSRVCDLHNSKPCSRVLAAGIYELELHGDRLAEIVGYDTAGGRGESTEVRLGSLRSGRSRRIAYQNIGENGQEYSGLSFSSRKLAWYRACFEFPGCAGSGAYRLGLSDGRYERALDPQTYAGWAWTGSATYTSQLSVRDHTCGLEEANTPPPCLVARDADPAWKHVAAGNVR